MRLPVQRQEIGVLGDQHQRDQRFGGNTALNDPRRRRGLHDRTLARTAVVARTARHKDAEGGRDDIEALGHILADLMERTAAAWANFVVDVDDLLDPFEMGGKRAAVGLALPDALIRYGRRLAFYPRLAERRLDILETQLQLIGIELLRSRAEPMAHEAVDDRLQPLDLPVGLSLGGRELGELPCLLKGGRASRFNIVGKVGFDEHGSSESVAESPVNRQSVARSDGARHARAASPDPTAGRQVGRPSVASHRPAYKASLELLPQIPPPGINLRRIQSVWTRDGADTFTSVAFGNDRGLHLGRPILSPPCAHENLKPLRALAHRIITRDYHSNSASQSVRARRPSAASYNRKVGSGLRLLRGRSGCRTNVGVASGRRGGPAQPRARSSFARDPMTQRESEHCADPDRSAALD